MRLLGRRGVVMAACALAAALALVLGGAAAWADIDAGAGGANSLTVTAGDDAAAAGMTFDVYKVASAAKDGTYDTYRYTFDIAPFDALAAGYDAEAMTGASWQALAEQADGLAAQADAAAAAVPVGQRVTGLADGLYLVVARPAAGEVASYTASPALVALPSKEPLRDADGAVVADADGFPLVGTAGEFGPWVRDVQAALKVAAEPLYGSLAIVKSVADFAGEPATFVFRITGTTPAGASYENYAAVYFAGGTSATTVVGRIPAGTQVRVEEVYAGARYELAGADDDVKTIASDAAVAAGAAQQAQAVFANTRNGSGVHGHGIQNNFELGEDGDWHWTATPERAVAAAGEGV